MSRPPAVRLCLAAVLMIAGASCSGGDKEAVTTTSTPSALSTTTVDPYAPVPGASPLTGLPLAGPAAQRPALVVKIDNAPKARPQVGINQADYVVEEKVEDGVTRLFTVFHSTEANPVGPVRSARSTDIFLSGSLNRPLFSYSGTNSTFQKLLNTAPLVDVGIDRTKEYYRERTRPAPYNLFSRTPSLWSHAPPGAGPPAPQFPFRPANVPLAAAGAAPVASAHLEFIGIHVQTIVDWRWDPAGGGVFRRWMDGTPHTDGNGEQVTARNVIIQFVEYIDTGIRDQSNTAVPEAKLLDEGEAWILTDGKVVRGRWSKPALADVTRYTDSAGKPVGLTPGRMWIELSPGGSVKLA